MKRFIKKLTTVLTVAILTLAVGVGLSSQSVYADAKDDACKGVGLATGSTDGCGTATDSNADASEIAATIINILSVVVGVVAVIMIIIGGFRYVTSGGDSNNTNAARNTILYAIIGLVIVALSQVIVVFVLNKV